MRHVCLKKELIVQALEDVFVVRARGYLYLCYVFLVFPSCNEPSMGPLMRDVKNKICTGEKIL